jgi:hypothetical protein
VANYFKCLSSKQTCARLNDIGGARTPAAMAGENISSSRSPTFDAVIREVAEETGCAAIVGGLIQH